MHPHSATTKGSLQLRLQAGPESAQLLRQRLYLWLDELGANSDEIFDVALASTEAFTNALKYPREPTARVIEVEGTLTRRTITVTVRDYGSWRRHRQREEGSYGFPLMRELMDTVGVHAQPDGTAITMQRELGRWQLPPSSTLRVLHHH